VLTEDAHLSTFGRTERFRGFQFGREPKALNSPHVSAFRPDEHLRHTWGAAEEQRAAVVELGISAIDSLIAALVAAPSFVHPDEWMPLIFGGRQPPLHENSPELRPVKTIFNRYNLLGQGDDAAAEPDVAGALRHGGDEHLRRGDQPEAA
jgi:hypothetical protein